jgi:hypothetical protein
VNPFTDPAHCGKCNNACSLVCLLGTCI